MHVIETLVVTEAALGSVPAEWDADRAVTALYGTHYRPLVRLAALLVRDVATAEEVVQDSFMAMHASWRRLRDTDKALSYLRQAVVNKSRSVLRHRMVVDRNAPKPPPLAPSAEQGAMTELERSAVVSALRRLPPGSARRWCCATTVTFPKPRSLPPWESAGARSRATRRAACLRCGPFWRWRSKVVGRVGRTAGER